jgi:hypothetical protein
MQISDPTFLPRLAVETIRSNALQSLRPGQVVRAEVLTVAGDGNITLRIGGSEVSARSPVTLNPGQQILLDVIKTDPLPELRLVLQASVHQIQTEALRSILPKQMPLPKLLQTLQQLVAPGTQLPGGPEAQTSALLSARLPAAVSATPGGTALTELQNILQGAANEPSLRRLFEQLGPEIAQRVNRVLQTGPARDGEISPVRLREWLLQSGLFLEANLAAGRPPGNDLKADLLTLLLQLRTRLEQELTQKLDRGPVGPETGARTQTSGEPESAITKLLHLLLRQAEGSLARVQLHQLSSLPTDDGTRHVWQFELPIPRPHGGHDEFLVRLERERNPNADDTEGYRWRVTLNFDLARLGPIQAQLSLLEEQEVSTLFLAERDESAQLIKEQLPLLEQALTRAGLRIGTLAAQQSGKLDAEPYQRSPQPLLDEKA